MLEAAIFAGPSLPNVEFKEGWKRLPPAGQGDLLRVLLRDKPRAFGLIDGWIYDRPPVGHKEILFALAEGVKVIGAGGIGAIRAAELHTFGMIGVGEVYNLYAETLIDGDDEVAVSTIDGKTATSVALVDVRATLKSAVADGIIDRELALKLISAARHLHYAERTYPLITDVVRRECGSIIALDAFNRWLVQGARSIKADDALCLLNSLADALREGAAPQTFVRPVETPAWARLYDRIATEAQGREREALK